MPIEVVTSAEFRKPHHPSCISSTTHRVLCMPLEMPDCAGHEPGFEETCYTRPDYVVTIPAAMSGVKATEKLACRKHLGYVVATCMPQFSDRHTSEATITFYEGA